MKPALAVALGAWLAATLLFAEPPSTARAQVVDQLRSDVRNGLPQPPDSPPPGHDRSHNDCNSSSDCDGDNFLSEAFGDIVTFVVAAPFVGPRVMLDDSFDQPGYFYRYPYWHDEPGMMFNTCMPGVREKTWQMEFAVEYGATFDDLSVVSCHMRMSTTSRFDMETNWSDLQQKTDGGRGHVTIGDVDLVYRFAQSPQWAFRSGVGANWFDDHQGAVAGFNVRYGVDWFPCRPWTVTALIDGGELGKVGQIHARTTVGAIYKRLELYTGYDFRRIGSVEFDGPVAGVLFRY